jgi:hypothetical protein
VFISTPVVVPQARRRNHASTDYMHRFQFRQLG